MAAATSPFLGSIEESSAYPLAFVILGRYQLADVPVSFAREVASFAEGDDANDAAVDFGDNTAWFSW